MRAPEDLCVLDPQAERLGLAVPIRQRAVTGIRHDDSSCLFQALRGDKPPSHAHLRQDALLCDGMGRAAAAPQQPPQRAPAARLGDRGGMGRSHIPPELVPPGHIWAPLRATALQPNAARHVSRKVLSSLMSPKKVHLENQANMTNHARIPCAACYQPTATPRPCLHAQAPALRPPTHTVPADLVLVAFPLLLLLLRLLPRRQQHAGQLRPDVAVGGRRRPAGQHLTQQLAHVGLEVGEGLPACVAAVRQSSTASLYLR